MDVHEKIIQIIEEILEEDTAEDFLNDEEWEWELDSLTFMQMIVMIEEEFGVELPDELLIFEGYKTIEELETFIIERMGENGAD